MKKAIFLFLVFLLARTVHAQLLDDSTVLVYGSSTVKVIREIDLLTNKDEYHAIDTSVYLLEAWDYYNKDRRYYQDLGNNGSARMPVFYQLPVMIGRTSGLNAYGHLLPDRVTIPYYDTKSPYMQVDGIVGGTGRSIAGGHFTQNIKPNWNFGFSFYRIISDKQIGATLNRFDRNYQAQTMSFHTFYDHEKLPYKLMFHINSLDMDVAETGGVFFRNDSTLRRSDQFQYRDSPIRLRGAISNDLQQNIYLYHEYGLLKQFELYHRMHRQGHTYKYRDFLDPTGAFNYNPYTDFYPRFIINDDTTREETRYRAFENEIGMKGNIGAVYYRFYVKNRWLTQTYTHGRFYGNMSELYAGGITGFRYKDLFNVSAQLELTPEGDYVLNGNLDSKLLRVSYTSMRHQQALLMQNFRGNHQRWINNFNQGFVNELTAQVNVPLGKMVISPRTRLVTINNFAYLDENIVSNITSGTLLLSQAGSELRLFIPTHDTSKEGIKIDGEFWLSRVTGRERDVLRIPQFFMNTRLYWDGEWFRDNIPVQWGIDFHSRSGYYANAFAPEIQQFYLQNQLRIDAYYTADLFLNMRVDKIFVFVKMVHINQPADDGYWVTPNYPGLRRMFDLGVKWLFFD